MRQYARFYGIQREHERTEHVGCTSGQVRFSLDMVDPDGHHNLGRRQLSRVRSGATRGLFGVALAFPVLLGVAATYGGLTHLLQYLRITLFRLFCPVALTIEIENTLTAVREPHFICILPFVI